MKKFKRLYTNGSSVTHGWPLCHSRYYDSYGKYYGIEPWEVVGGEEQLDSRISINWPSRTIISSEPGTFISSAATRPRIRSARDVITSPSLTAGSAVIELAVPQSFILTIQS